MIVLKTICALKFKKALTDEQKSQSHRDRRLAAERVPESEKFAFGIGARS
jgi:hypothetical protein